MKKRNKNEASVDLISLVNSHEKPFVVINENYEIMAVNAAYEQEYGISHKDSAGKMCYQVIRGRNRPCKLDGDECPHNDIFNCADKNRLSPMHYDATRRSHQVKITAFPLMSADNELMLGKCVDQVFPPPERLKSYERMVGHSSAFNECVSHLDVASNYDAPVLLQGFTGTGKELAAAYIHQHSSRSSAAFQIIDCTVLTEATFESEMFGHDNGAFAGCVGDKLGLYEMSDGGTVFFDKIADLALPLQSKLLRVIESGQFRRAGGNTIHSADVRIVCATNRDLWKQVSEGKFREDLYHRIACFTINIPTLMERIDDIPEIAQALLDNINRTNETAYYLLPEGSEQLKRYTYSGNIRELKNILFVAATRCSDNKIDKSVIEDVLENMHLNPGAKLIEEQDNEIPSSSQVFEHHNQVVSLTSIEYRHIRDLLAKHKGHRKDTADELGISERTLYRKLKKLGICSEDS